MNVLIVVAHPDDEVLGCGIAIQSHISKEDRVHVLSMTNGGDRYVGNTIIEDIDNVVNFFGLESFGLMGFPDQALDTLALTELIIPIEKAIKRYQIDMVYTHHYGDINKDHRLTYEATITACRPTPTCPIKKLLSYWVPSSSEWMPYDNSDFKPNFVIEADEIALEDKIRALKMYKSEMRSFPHPRSAEGVATSAKNFGMQFGYKYAEAFQLLYER